MSVFQSRQLRENDDARDLVRSARRVELEVPEGARERVWHAVRRGRHRSSTRKTWSIFFASATVVGALVLFVWQRTPQPSALQLVGDRAVRIASGQALQATDALSRIDLGGQAQAVAGPHTRAVLERFDDQHIVLRLDEGSLLVHVEPRLGRGPVIIDTPAFSARVVGTVFRVTVSPRGESALAVAHGKVELTPRGGMPVLVAGGQHWPAGANEAPLTNELALLGDPTPEDVTLENFLPAPRTPSCAGEPLARVRCKLKIAQEADATSAENALYEAGSIVWRELSDGRHALAIWRQQRERFPNGALRSEVQASIIDALVAMHSLRDAETEIQRYLTANPDGLRAAEMHFVLGTIERELDHDCRRADSEFAQALEHPVESWAGRARAARHTCRSHD